MKGKNTISREAHIKNVTASMLNILIMHRNGEMANIGKLEISIAEEPADQLFKDRCRREIELLRERIDDTQQLIDYIKKFEIAGVPVKDKKAYQSKNRAIGFCILLMEQSGIIVKDLPKTQLKEEIKKHFPGTSAHKIYLLLRAGGLEDKATKKKFSLSLEHTSQFELDYEYGLMLFKRKTG